MVTVSGHVHAASHLGFQCSVETLNDTGFGLLVVSGKELHVVFLEKLRDKQRTSH
jgi:hypothetical protein